jgi:hypothetical protein
MKSVRVRRWLAIPAAALVGVALAFTSAPAQAQNDWVEPPSSYMSTILTGGDYVWTAAVWQPAPALLAYGWDEANQQEVPIPPEWAGTYQLQPMTITFAWGDGSSTTFTSDVRTDGTWVWCDNGVEYGDGGVLQPSEGFGYNCRVEAQHTYASQGVLDLTLSVTQGGETAAATSTEFVVDPTTGGTLTVKGTVEARFGGMYDQNFPQPGDDTTTNVSITAKRRAGTTATTATVLISVPGMHPEWNSATGMSFRGAYALQPLYVAKTKTGGEALLLRVEGRVTNSKGDAGGAQAAIRVKVAKGSPTLIRVQVWNTSAGYSYLDTGFQPESWLGLSASDVLLSGTVRLG